MNIITSKHNQYVKNAIELKQKKVRDKSGCALIEGRKVLLEAFKSNYIIQSIFCNQQNYEISKRFCDNIFVVNDEILKSISSTVTPQGIIAVIKQKKFYLKDLNDSFILLDTIQDPTNMGAIIRSSVAVDIKNIVAINSVDFFNDKVIRCSAGTLFKANLFSCSYQDVLRMYDNYSMICADMDGENIFDFKLTNNKFCIVIGNEGNGVSENLRKICHNIISIPMANGVESLNASVTAGIMLYYLTTKK